MSLHGKIVAWFVFFASLTVMLFVLGDYYQSTRALRVALETRGSALAGQAAVEIERRYDRAQAELQSLGYDILAGDDEAAATASDYATLQVFSGDRLVWSKAAPAADVEPHDCAYTLVPLGARLRDPRGGSYRVEAAMHAAHFFQPLRALSSRLGRGGITSVMTRQGALLYDTGCTIRANPVPVAFESAIAEQVITSADQAGVVLVELPGEHGGEHVLAIADVELPDWAVVVGVDHREFAAPFAAARTQYLAIMIAAMMVALLLVLRMIRHDMKRLSAISAAADAIGHGRFDVWLPPPTNDEVGRLSMALGGMVHRLSSTLHQMEISRAMAAVGELATYLSHEIRNPLSSIRLNLQMLRRDLATDAVPEDGPELVGLCLTELQRLDDVVKTVLDVGRNSEPVPGGRCDVHEVVAQTVLVMQSKLRAHGIDIETRFGANESRVAMDGAQLKSVLVNLLLNSIDALAASARKRITVTTELHDATAGQGQLELRVIDTGPGVPAHLRERIFEPFFTTKSSGNGIGLATALRMVQQSGGLLRCPPSQEWTGGAEFVIELPLEDSHAGTHTRTATAAAG